MTILNPQFLFDLESNLRVIQENEYRRVLDSGNIWYPEVTRIIPVRTGRELLTWVLNTAILEGRGLDPTPTYSEMALMRTEFVPEYVNAAIELQRAQFEDLDGNGIDIASEWVAQIGAQGAYYPQKVISGLINAGETGKGYDALAFFANNHPVNPKDSSKGTYANLFTGAASSTPSTDPGDSVYPGAIPISSAVTDEVLFRALQSIFTYIATMKMPDGITPRFLRPSSILCPSNTYTRISGVLDSKFISAANSGTGGGTTHFEGQLGKLGYGKVLLAPELNADPTTSCIVVAEQMTSSQLGGLAYVDREPVGIRYFTGQGGGDGADAVLSENDTLKYIARGRSVGGYGHPFFVYKAKQT